MPGYPRVSSVPPRSLNCNGYPGLNEYGGNSLSTSVTNQSVTNTPPIQSNQMQPPSTPHRPNSSNQMYQQQHSPGPNNNVNMSPNAQAQSPSHNQSGGYQQQQQQSQHQDWNQNTWNDGRQRSNETFIQSDRINLNTRLKTMILNKNEKDQQQAQPNHFLSYSHQHLSEQQHPHVNNRDIIDSNKPIKYEMKQIAGDVGGAEMDESWKSSETEVKQELQENETREFQKKEPKINENVESARTREMEGAKKSETELESIEQQNFASCDRQQINSPSAPTRTEKSIEGEREREKQSYSYHSAHEYQQHKNMVNNIKKEPFEETSVGNVKYEGYEKNYQNFIRYADFCDAQQPQFDQKVSPYHQEYMQPHGYHNNYSYSGQSCAPLSQNYPQHSQNYQQFMTQQTAYQQHGQFQGNPHHSASLTNFEQQIPLHAYPIPKQSAGGIEDSIFPPNSSKIDPHQAANSPHPYATMGDSMKHPNKHDEGIKYQRSHTPMENLCNSKPPHDEVNFIFYSTLFAAFSLNYNFKFSRLKRRKFCPKSRHPNRKLQSKKLHQTAALVEAKSKRQRTPTTKETTNRKFQTATAFRTIKSHPNPEVIIHIWVCLVFGCFACKY